MPSALRCTLIPNSFCFLERLLNLDLKSWLEATVSDKSDFPTVRAGYIHLSLLVCLGESTEAFLAVIVVALELFL